MLLKNGFNRATVNSLEEIGVIVRAVRKENQLTQEQAALMCGVNPRVLSELENGKEKDFSLRTILKIVNTLGIVIELKRRKI